MVKMKLKKSVIGKGVVCLLLAFVPWSATLSARAQTERGYLDTNGKWIETEKQKDRRMGWWREARFGMFIHWGLYAVTAGEWNGKWQTNKYGEWIQIHFKIPVKEYEGLAAKFNPVQFNAREWVRLAKRAGMKYIVITAKHHDGFAMYDSKVNDFNIVKQTPFKRDPMKELAQACREEGLKLCFYYSQSQDWHEPDALGNTWDFPDGFVDKSLSNKRKWVRKDFQKYIDRKAMPQVRELLTNYGPIGIIWYDTPRTITLKQSRDFIHVVRRLQPDCLLNSRVGHRLGDYGSTGDNAIPGSRRVGDWEMPGTMNHTWGYRKDDNDWRSSTTLIHNLVNIVSMGGNYLLNVGPTAEGLIPGPSVKSLQDIGAWMDKNSESIYGTDASPFGKLEWGRCTSKAGRLYLHVFDWPKGELVLRRLKSSVRKAYLLSDAKRNALKYTHEDGILSIVVPERAPDEVDTVVVVEIDDEVSVGKAPLPQGVEGSLRKGKGAE